MPHADLKFSNDLNLDAVALLRAIEQIIQQHDAGSGECKGRAHPATHFNHTHCLLDISMLTKPHRDSKFTQSLLNDLKSEMERHLAQPCHLSLGIHYSDDNYITSKHEPSDR
tara:strand:- start:13496 stop:13831 length:336 start_codon:yes stop_codon:yes gene_type:complete